MPKLGSISRLASTCFAMATIGSLLSLQAPPLAAQSPQEGVGEEIVVEGHRRAVRDFVAAMTDTNRSRQLGRWNDEICPTVVGIADSQAQFMAERIGEIAAPLRLRRRAGDCLTTMLVIVSADAPALAAALADAYPVRLRADGRSRLNRFVASAHPVRWLSITDPCGGRGCPLPNSRIRQSTNPRFQAMIVIVDARQIEGFSLGELSDYVALVALSNPPLRDSWPETSILSMFDRERTPAEQFQLTDRDRAYLAGLYRTRGDGSGQEQRSAIVSQMDDEPDEE